MPVTEDIGERAAKLEVDALNEIELAMGANSICQDPKARITISTIVPWV